MNEEIKKYTEMFHNTYEMLAPKYGYETRGDTKQLDFDSPNGKLMYATIEKIVCPILEENQQLKGSLQTYEILLKANVEENQQLKEQLQQKGDIINKAREELYIWGETLNPEFQKRMLEILDNKGE